MTKPIKIKDIVIGEGIPKICVPIMGKDMAALSREARAAYEAGAELVEWRADFFDEIFNKDAVEKALNVLCSILGRIPLLFTIRTKAEGGNLQISTEDYVNCLLRTAETKKASLIDVEVFKDTEKMTSLTEELHRRNVKVIASTHDFDKTDDRETLKARFLAMDRTGADILKMAVMPKEFQDVAALMQVTSEVSGTCTDKPLISMAMGSLGSISRISGENFGSAVTFACLGEASAPGQLPVKELRMMLEALHRKNKE